MSTGTPTVPVFVLLSATAVSVPQWRDSTSRSGRAKLLFLTGPRGQLVVRSGIHRVVRYFPAWLFIWQYSPPPPHLFVVAWFVIVFVNRFGSAGGIACISLSHLRNYSTSRSPFVSYVPLRSFSSVQAKPR